MAKKLSVLKPRRLRNMIFYPFLFHYNFEDTETNFEKGVF